MNSKELWEMFATTGDIELYDMYRTLKEDESEELSLKSSEKSLKTNE